MAAAWRGFPYDACRFARLHEVLTLTMIHPTAIISPDAKIAPDANIGPYCVIDGLVTIGPGCVLHPFVRLLGPLTMGARNVIHSHAVIGDYPQDRKFDGAFSQTILGDENVVREHATIHRGTGENTKTLIGSRCYFMVNAHVGHNCVVADDVTLVNNSMLAGHVHIGERAIIGGGCAVHQFCRVGRLAMLSNVSAHMVDIPPFFIAMTTNHVTQLNVVGLRRAGIPRENISALRRLFQFIRTQRMTRAALEQIPPELLAFPEVQEWIDFCRQTKRGVALFQPWSDRGGVDTTSEFSENPG
jgi:UDP-N-acetylglucosamine acyltransferase